MIELEKTYLAKEIPKDIEKCEHKEILDIYIPKSSEHAYLRIRKNGDKYEVTKKIPNNKNFDSFTEHNTPLTKEEFDELEQSVEGKRIRKIRYNYKYKGLIAEIDVFQDALKGLVVVEVEFPDEKTRDSFEIPSFCLVDVTKEGFIAGGFLCGKSYADIEYYLKKKNYTKEK